MRHFHLKPVLIVTCALLIAGTGCGDSAEDNPGSSEEAFTVRPFTPVDQQRWLGNAVCYGPHRDGQRPGGPDPTADQIREDLQLMVPHWNLMRIYAAGDLAETILRVIREDGFDMKVMLGVWIAPDDAAANGRQVTSGIRLAQEYADIVMAVSVGNETQIEWSAHVSSLDSLIGHVQRVRAGVKQPVTAADDFNFWNKEKSRRLAREIDFIAMHAHPLWNGLQLEDALAWTVAQVDSVRSLHPDRPVVLVETGWATMAHDQGEQARLIKGRFGEPEQAVFYRQTRAWADSTRTVVFHFEAFDENWKGSDHPDEVEKHWGFFRSDRSPKAALAEGY
jgi:exo-beta-1,3-glucanase (GH17 family)